MHFITHIAVLPCLLVFRSYSSSSFRKSRFIGRTKTSNDMTYLFIQFIAFHSDDVAVVRNDSFKMIQLSYLLLLCHFVNVFPFSCIVLLQIKVPS